MEANGLVKASKYSSDYKLAIYSIYHTQTKDPQEIRKILNAISVVISLNEVQTAVQQLQRNGLSVPVTGILAPGTEQSSVSEDGNREEPVEQEEPSPASTSRARDERAYTSRRCAWPLRGVCSGLLLFTVVSASVAVILMYAQSRHFELFESFNQSSTHDESRLALSDFVKSTNETLQQQLSAMKVDDLPVSQYNLFSRATCVTSANLQYAKEAMLEKLHNLPMGIGNDIINKAFSEGTLKNYDAYRDCKSSETRDVYCYYIFYHTLVSPKQTSSCVVVTGVTLKIGDQFDYFDETVEDKIIGHEDQCWDEPILFGLSSTRKCARKAILTQVKRKFPIFKTSVMSLKEAEALFALVSRNAVDSAKHLIVGSTSDATSAGQLPNSQWKSFEAPRTAHFGEKQERIGA